MSFLPFDLQRLPFYQTVQSLSSRLCPVAAFSPLGTQPSAFQDRSLPGGKQRLPNAILVKNLGAAFGVAEHFQDHSNL